MKKVTTMVLMLFMVLSGALCYASGADALQTTNVTIRASDHIIVSGPFEVPIGAKLTMMVHPCPYPENDLQ